MSEFVVSARKYRPNSFNSVVGQESITSTLENSIKTGQMAQAYLFCGPRGVGKTSCARIFAKIINQDSLGENEDLSFNIFELDAASNNSVEDIRYITDQVRIPPQVGKYKVYIIDEVHMLSSAAFNAFLKTLEEPPPHAIFILATTEKHKIIPTILSRCQVYNFNRIKVVDMVAHLEKIAEKEGITYEKEALYVIAEKADGALRDSLSIFDQIVNFSNRNITYDSVIQNLNVLDYNYYFRIVEAINKHNISDCLLALDEILNHGFDGHHFITGLGSHFRDLLVSKSPETVKLLEVGENVKEKYLSQSVETSARTLVKGLELISDADTHYKTSKNQRLLVELTLIKLSSLGQSEQKKNLETKENSKVSETEIKSPSENSNSSSVVAATVQEVKAMPVTPGPKVVEEIQKQPEPQEKPKVVSKPIVKNTNFSGFSIKQTLEKKQEQAEEEERKDKDEFTLEQLMVKWQEYAVSVNDKNKKTLHTALTCNTPELKDGFVIEHVLDNKTLFDNFNREKQTFLDYLKKELNNYFIQLQAKLVKNEKAEVFLYTDKEKFLKLSETKPELLYLKDKLNLDFEF
ncbi:MAG: DNA polymerase III subunit gamma/tau [Flavobacteriales bacterium]